MEPLQRALHHAGGVRTNQQQQAKPRAKSVRPCCRRQSFRHKTLGGRCSRWVRWDPRACPQYRRACKEEPNARMKRGEGGPGDSTWRRTPAYWTCASTSAEAKPNADVRQYPQRDGPTTSGSPAANLDQLGRRRRPFWSSLGPGPECACPPAAAKRWWDHDSSTQHRAGLVRAVAGPFRRSARPRSPSGRCSPTPSQRPPAERGQAVAIVGFVLVWQQPALLQLFYLKGLQASAPVGVAEAGHLR